MKVTGHILSVAILGLLSGCARIPKSEQAHSDANSEIVIVVAGSVNRPNETQNLRRPFTIKHAIKQAGGFNEFAQDGNNEVLIVHKDLSQASVPRKNYSSYLLTNGDTVYVWRQVVGDNKKE